MNSFHEIAARPLLDVSSTKPHGLIEPGKSMVIAWRVVAVDMTGTQVIVDEGLTQERALEIANAMLSKGHSVIIQAEPTRWQPQISSIAHVWPTGRLFPRRR